MSRKRGYVIRVDEDFFDMVKKDKKKQKELLGLDLSDKDITKLYAKKLKKNDYMIEL